MEPFEPASAVVVRVSLPRPLARLRSRWDPVAAVGVPPHITILFPFLPAERLDPSVRVDLAEIAAGIEPFEVRFEAVARFPTVVYLVPEPATPFVRLTEMVARRFPEHPPYGGAFDEIVPHLTVCESSDAPADAIAERAERSLPFVRRVTALEILVEGDGSPWRERWRIPVGVRR